MQRTPKSFGTLALVLVVGGGAFVAGRALAGGAPAKGALSYAGTLEDADGSAALQTGDHNVVVQFFSVAADGDPACDSGKPQALKLDMHGRFSVLLPDACSKVVGANADLWSEVLVDGASLGRSKVGAVPYALEAAHATAADAAATADTANKAGGALKTLLDGLSAAPSRVEMVNMTPFSLPATTFTKVPYATENIDDLNEFLAGTFTAKSLGDYLVCASITLAAGVPFELDLFVNGEREHAIVRSTLGGTGCRVLRLSAGAKLDVRVYAETAVSVGNDVDWDWMTISRVR